MRRHFTLTELAGITGDVSAASDSVTADVVTSDFLKVYSFVDGVPSEPVRQDLGSASWEGALLAVDTQTFGPVFGLAHLSMDLNALALSPPCSTISCKTAEAWANHGPAPNRSATP